MSNETEINNRYYSREFTKDDADAINNLYFTVTGVNRSLEKYNWEWLDTWDGMGSSWLMFDHERQSQDKLVCQYSLIPIPISFYGDSFVFGKTENCMSHPDLRGKRLYFPHERTYFELAKNRFQGFFTTTGKGPPGRVRRKLGYSALDFWTRYYYFHNIKNCLNYHLDNAKRDSVGKGKLFKYSFLLAKVTYGLIEYIKTMSVNVKLSVEFNYKSYTSSEAPLDLIVSFWNKNKSNFGITIDRTKEYLKWRVDENPHHDYSYLLLYKKHLLIGYVIYKVDGGNLSSILDIVVESNNQVYYKNIISALILESKKVKSYGILCRTVFQNELLKEAFRFFGSRRKISNSWVKSQEMKGKEVHDFYGVISNDVDHSSKSEDPKNWYITSLFLEY